MYGGPISEQCATRTNIEQEPLDNPEADGKAVDEIS